VGEVHTVTYAVHFLNLTVKTALKSVHCWRSYRQKYVGSFLWLTEYIDVL